MGGPTGQQKANQKAQAAFYNQMTQEQSITFGEDQELLNSIKAIELPILMAGPNQYGFTTAEDEALKSEIINTGARQTAGAIDAAMQRAKQATGGTAVLPTGAGEELELNADVLGRQATSTNLLNEKLAGYAAGKQNYQTALAALTGAPGELASASSPFISGVNAAGGNANQSAEEVYQAESSIPMAILGGVMGGVSNIPLAFAGKG